MLKGDLATTPFRAVITDLAASDALGCLHVEGPDGDEALVYFKTGSIYSTYLPGRRPQLGARLISSGALAPEALEEALEAQATELQGWRLGELLVHLGFVESDVVESFGIEQVRDACFEMSRWPAGKWKFRKNEKTREDIAAACEVPAIIDEILRREQEWAILVEVIRGTDSVPTLGAGGLASAEMALNQDEWALLCKVDGERNIHQLARDCGFTDFEAGQIVSSLVMTGLLEIDGPSAVRASADADEDGAEPLPPRSAAQRLMAAFAGSGDPETDVTDDVDYAADDDGADLAMPSYLNSLVMPLVADDIEYADEGSVGSELSRLLASRDDIDVIDEFVVEEITAAPESAEPLDGETQDSEPQEAEPEDSEPEDSEPQEPAYTSYALPPLDPTAFEDEPYSDPDAALPRYSVGFGRRDAFDESLSAVSEALSALLGNQPAAAALSTFAAEYQFSDESEEEQRQRVIREAAAAEMSAAHAEMEEQRRRFDEARRRAEQTANEDAAAEQAVLEAERAATAEAARLVAEEEARVVAEAARLAAEEEAARLAAEAEARSAAQEQARVVAEEAARVAAEQEAARVAAEEDARIEAEEAARLAAEEAAQIAAETAARAAAEEADRAAAEQERQIAAEEAARVAAEDEAARHAQQQEVDEQAAEDNAAAADEAARVAAAEVAHAAEEQEAARLDAEEAARVAAEQEAARIAAEEEAARIALEAETARIAAEEAARVAAELAAAEALLDLEQFTPPAPPPPPAPVAAPVMTDTASLMRELSSLGFDDEPAPAPMPNRPSTGVGAAARQSAAQSDKGKKRKGLFGRG